MLSGYRLNVGGAFVVRVDDEGWITDLWPYAFPGFGLTFPASGHTATAPAYAAGTSEHARTLYESWVETMRSGEPLDVAVIRSLAPDGVVHLPNRDSGPGALLAELFGRIRSGFPDYSVALQDAVVHEAWLIVQFTAVGTHTAVMGAYPPSGHRLPSTGMGLQLVRMCTGVLPRSGCTWAPDMLLVFRTRAFWQRFLEVAGQAPHLMAGINTMTAPDGRVMLPNGDFVTTRESDELALKWSDSFPDLMVEIDDVFYPDERVVVQLRMVGSIPSGSPFMPAGQPYTSHGCAIVRPNADLLIEEAISISNPGFPFSFPPSGIKLTPPPDDATDLEARALFSSWVRHAEAGDDFVTSVIRTLAPDGVVHIGNGDSGNGKTLASLFERVMVGLPDLTMVIDDVIYCDVRMIVRFTMSGTHTGPLGMYPPTGRVLPSVGILIARPNANSQAAELWICVAPAYSVLMPPKG